MEIKKEHIDHIRQKFNVLQSKKDLAKLLNEAKIFMYGEDCKPIKLKSLTYYANPEICKSRYTSFTIKKKSGGERIINAPVKGLRSILRVVNFVLQCIHEPHKAATGFVRERSIVDNARIHVGRNYVYNLDLQDFFHSFDRNRVKMGFWMEPFNLKGDKEPIAFLLASLCTHPFTIEGEKKIVLPQGSPTSPTITNILCYKLDRRLNGLAKRFNLSYTRYADDITFSSSSNIYQDEEFQEELNRIIVENQGLSINQKKVRNQPFTSRQAVTGLVVNEKINVHRKYVKQLRMWLYYWERYGYNKAEQLFRRDYVEERGHTQTKNPSLSTVIFGKLEFLKMVKGEKDNTYRKLSLRYTDLNAGSTKGYDKKKAAKKDQKTLKYYDVDTNVDTNTVREPTEPYRTSNPQDIVDLIFEQGLDKAMEQYKPGSTTPTKWNIEEIFSSEKLLEMETIFETMKSDMLNNSENNEL